MQCVCWHTCDPIEIVIDVSLLKSHCELAVGLNPSFTNVFRSVIHCIASHFCDEV